MFLLQIGFFASITLLYAALPCAVCSNALCRVAARSAAVARTCESLNSSSSNSSCDLTFSGESFEWYHQRVVAFFIEDIH